MCSKINQPDASDRDNHTPIFTPPTMSEWLSANAENIALLYVQDCARLEVEAYARAGALPSDGTSVQLRFCVASVRPAKPVTPKKRAEKPPTITRKNRYRALKKSNGKCALCGRGASDGIVLEVDHIEPIKVAPHRVNDETNLQVLCAECNDGKSWHDSTDWRQQP